MKFNRDKYLLATCDMIVEGVDFKLSEQPRLIGRKALAVSISDIAACAGIPRYCLVSMGLPKQSSLEFVNQVLAGLLDLAKRYKINIVGGDISRAKQLSLSTTVIGIVEKKKLALRSGAKEGDVIFITGPLGGSICGKHLRFVPRIKEARFLTQNFKVNSMIDISDGLSCDLWHILKESRVGAIIFEELIPKSENCSGLNDALYSGEDFELIFTLGLSDAKRLMRTTLKFYPIGNIVQRRLGLRLVKKDARVMSVKPQGFRHF
jgi:thiamine-monophosphate kinase